VTLPLSPARRPLRPPMGASRRLARASPSRLVIVRSGSGRVSPAASATAPRRLPSFGLRIENASSRRRLVERSPRQSADREEASERPVRLDNPFDGGACTAARVARTGDAASDDARRLKAGVSSGIPTMRSSSCVSASSSAPLVISLISSSRLISPFRLSASTAPRLSTMKRSPTEWATVAAI